MGVPGFGALCSRVRVAVLLNDPRRGVGARHGWGLPHGGQHGLHVRCGHRLPQGWPGDGCLDLGHPLGHLGFNCILVYLPPRLLQLLAHSPHGSGHVWNLPTGVQTPLVNVKV